MTNYFNGYIEVDNTTDLVVGVYDETDLHTNLIYSTEPPLLGPNTWGFMYSDKDGVLYDDAKQPPWKQFDTYGLVIKANTNINSAFYNSDYEYYNFSAVTDPTTSTLGTIFGFSDGTTPSIPRQIITTLIPTVNPTCFNEGTKILCFDFINKEEIYIPIEKITKNNLVKTYKNGYRKITEIEKGILKNDPENWRSCMYIMKKTDKTPELLDDIIVTGGHSLLVDKISYREMLKQKKYLNQSFKIEDKNLLFAAASNKFTQIKDNKIYKYYHLKLEEDKKYGIWANGILMETKF